VEDQPHAGNKLFDLGNKDLPKRASERVARGEIATTP
jgi:hypothetical protein